MKSTMNLLKVGLLKKKNTNMVKNGRGGGQKGLKCLTVLFVAFFGVCFALNFQNNLFATISPNDCYVTFDPGEGQWSDGNSDSKKVNVGRDHKVEQQTEPTREGYDFVGWFQGGKKFNFESIIRENITLIAVWKKREVIYQFDEDGAIDAYNESKYVTLTIKKYFKDDDGKWIKDKFKDYIGADGEFTKPTEGEGLKNYNAIFSEIFSTVDATDNDMRFEIGYKRSSDQEYTTLNPRDIVIKQADVDLPNNCLIIVLSVPGYDEAAEKYQFGFRESYVPKDYVFSGESSSDT